ncbi:class IIb bacteriocin, lactobin A/cerein 7B family [Cellulosilyticum sp. ST5]|uniref:class IIb bacteriocin, lactobin A/cerein 7B family n=1 Tax=unclassified Cellulosilyticum TaxID=2643091 RepID=UPI000F8C3B5F|nr:class IIb bacteriocin, lactobin A/cerein 7B family [Cellulosilyticum sp. WCF-2]QEH67516.1 class IIb bacteriocin, lactobin A/cerein 7B family [Cellulosilyticum sp. WCF-2]
MNSLQITNEFKTLDSNELLEIEGGSILGTIAVGAKAVAAAAATTAGVTVIVAVAAVAVVGVCIYAGTQSGKNKADKEYYENHK